MLRSRPVPLLQQLLLLANKRQHELERRLALGAPKPRWPLLPPRLLLFFLDEAPQLCDARIVHAVFQVPPSVSGHHADQ